MEEFFARKWRWLLVLVILAGLTGGTVWYLLPRKHVDVTTYFAPLDQYDREEFLAWLAEGSKISSEMKIQAALYREDTAWAAKQGRPLCSLPLLKIGREAGGYGIFSEQLSGAWIPQLGPEPAMTATLLDWSLHKAEEQVNKLVVDYAPSFKIKLSLMVQKH